jgi:flagellar biosynthesis protein FlhF
MNAPIRIKSFRAKNLTEALKMVRTELGPDATILETKPAPRSKLGWSRFRVQVTASSGCSAPAEAMDPIEDPSTEDAPQGETSPENSEKPIDACPVPTSIPTSIPADWTNECEFYNDVYMQVASRLLLNDVPAATIERWLRQSHDQLGSNVQDAWLLRAHIARLIRHEIPVDAPSASWLTRREVIAVIGPSGHGKSSAVAKLAGVASMQLGLRPLVIACETELAPANPQLAGYSSLMGWGYEQADAPKLPRQGLATSSDHDWVAIDVPGVPMGDREGLERMRGWLTQLGVTQVHLTLAATTGDTHVRRSLDWYQGLQPSHLLLTKLDEALGLGSLVPCLAAAHLPLGFVSVGPRVPSDFLECDGPRLAHWLLGSDPAEPLPLH